MPMPNYQIRNAPPLMDKKPGVGELALDFAKSKALTAGLEAAFPGGGLAKEGAEAILPAFLAGGGPLGGGQTKEGLMQARQMGALTQKEFLEAMKYGGYLKNEGGDVKPWWAGTAKALEESKKKPRGEKLKRSSKADAKSDLMGVAASLVPLLFRETGGPIPGMTPGPLGMKDMLNAGKGKDVSKVKYKRTGGKASSEVEIGYHAPLAPKGE